jgi:hypothetical protein
MNYLLYLLGIFITSMVVSFIVTVTIGIIIIKIKDKKDGL